MYILLLALLVGSGLWLHLRGREIQRPGITRLGSGMVATTLLLFGFMSFWGEHLWFAELGYDGRFWTAVGAQIIVTLSSIVLSVCIIALPWLAAGRSSRPPSRAMMAGAGMGGLWGYVQWSVVLKFWHRVETGVVDPLFGQDTGFYLFTLPFLNSLLFLLTVLAFISLLDMALDVARSIDWEAWPTPINGSRTAGYRLPPANGSEGFRSLAAALRPLYASLGLLGILLAGRYYLAIFNMMHSRHGIVSGPGWIDFQVRRPVYYALAIMALVGGLYFIVRSFKRAAIQASPRHLSYSVGAPFGAILATAVLGLVVAPLLLQRLYVEPNEITVERPYIRHNIDFTRRGFQLDKVESREYSLLGPLTAEIAAKNRNLLKEIRLWDPRVLAAVYQQFQEIRLYYEFPHIDIDRYHIDGRYRQVLVSPREMETANLPADSRTFVNRHFKYTHGYGLTLAPVSDFTPAGLPNLLIKDIPPQSAHPSLAVTSPSIYFGELTSDYVIVNAKEREFHYPSAGENVYSYYEGSGGVPLSSLWRKFLFGWKIGGTSLLLTSYTTDESRIMFRRNVHERVAAIAPFLKLDQDPYIVLVDGKLYWILDGYTTSRHFPYSEPLDATEFIQVRGRHTEGPGSGARFASGGVSSNLQGVNYVRNSVKAVVDAYNGSVSLYNFEPDDPLIQVWNRIFPDLFKSKEEMPAGLRSHVRYPEGFLLAQGLVYSKYHMTDPVVFYNQEDLWVRATEKYYDDIVPVDPYYVMWNPDQEGGSDINFSLILPFTPKNRQVLVGWMAGLCDGENYGRLISYRFPKQQWVPGPQQVDTKIDQDPNLSERLTLWDQRGSQVIRGNVLAIPMDNTLLYVEPIYLQADAAAYPELRLVTLMSGDRFSSAETFDKALEALVGKPPLVEKEDLIKSKLSSNRIARAQRVFDSYARLMGERRYVDAGRELQRLSETLREQSANGEAALSH